MSSGIIRFMYYRVMKVCCRDKYEILEAKMEFEKFAGRYCKYANIIPKRDIVHVCTELRILTHVIEKGLTLPRIKRGFGKEKIQDIISLLHLYEQIGDDSCDREAYENGIKILKTYASYADKYQLEIDNIEDKYLQEGNDSDLGVRQIEYHESNIQSLSFKKFAESRHSIRGFVDKDISNEQILDIIRLAQTTPSACNRQDIKVICVKEPEKVKKLMEIHQGAKGFGCPSCVMLVVSDLRMYNKYEMSLPYFDGGLFAMNLIYAIHYYGYGSCPLIWEDSCNGEILREIVDIPDYFMVNVFIAVGGVSDTPTVAVSKKRNVHDVVKII